MRTIEETISIFEKNETVTEILEIISEQSLPDAWFVAGSVYRNLWNIMCDYPIEFKTDIDVAFYDPNMTYDESETLNKNIREAYPQFDWEIKNEFVSTSEMDMKKNMVQQKMLFQNFQKWLLR